MLYTSITLSIKDNSEEKREVLIALLDGLGYEGINEYDDRIVAFISNESFSREIVEETLGTVKDFMLAEITEEVEVKEKNWNEEWESNFEPVIIGNSCAIRAPFHESFEGFEYVITMEPKMAFGTGHHQTTSMMAEAMLETNLEHKIVLDMGCGTGVLAILAAMRKAESVTAIDYDNWSYESAIENANRNSVELEVILGGKEAIPNKKFDIIYANINRNILIDQSEHYAKALKQGGLLFLSGILKEDKNLVSDCFQNLGFKYDSEKTKDNWLMLKMVRE